MYEMLFIEFSSFMEIKFLEFRAFGNCLHYSFFPFCFFASLVGLSFSGPNLAECQWSCWGLWKTFYQKNIWKSLLNLEKTWWKIVEFSWRKKVLFTTFGSLYWSGILILCLWCDECGGAHVLSILIRFVWVSFENGFFLCWGFVQVLRGKFDENCKEENWLLCPSENFQEKAEFYGVFNEIYWKFYKKPKY